MERNTQEQVYSKCTYWLVLQLVAKWDDAGAKEKCGKIGYLDNRKGQDGCCNIRLQSQNICASPGGQVAGAEV